MRASVYTPYVFVCESACILVRFVEMGFNAFYITTQGVFVAELKKKMVGWLLVEELMR